MPLCFSHACCHASVIHAAVNLAAPQVAGGEATADSISSQPARDPFADEEPEFRALANKFLDAGMAHAACTACALTHAWVCAHVPTCMRTCGYTPTRRTPALHTWQGTDFQLLMRSLGKEQVLKSSRKNLGQQKVTERSWNGRHTHACVRAHTHAVMQSCMHAHVHTHMHAACAGNIQWCWFSTQRLEASLVQATAAQR